MMVNPMNPSEQAIREAAAQGKQFKVSKFSNATRDFTKNVRLVDVETAVRKARQFFTIEDEFFGDSFEYHPFKVEII